MLQTLLPEKVKISQIFLKKLIAQVWLKVKPC